LLHARLLLEQLLKSWLSAELSEMLLKESRSVIVGLGPHPSTFRMEVVEVEKLLKLGLVVQAAGQKVVRSVGRPLNDTCNSIPLCGRTNFGDLVEGFRHVHLAILWELETVDVSDQRSQRVDVASWYQVFPVSLFERVSRCGMNFSSLGAVSHGVVYEMIRTSGENHSVCVDEVVIPEYEDQIRGVRIVVEAVGAGISKKFIERNAHVGTHFWKSS
jgi:hypothetical protein